jgi:hypothetical protein
MLERVMNGAVSHFFLLHQRSVYVVLLFHVLEPFHSVASPAAVLALPSHNGAQVSPIPEVAASKPVLTSRQFASDPVVTAVHPNPAVALSISLGTLRPKSGSGFGNGVVVLGGVPLHVPFSSHTYQYSYSREEFNS